MPTHNNSLGRFRSGTIVRFTHAADRLSNYRWSIVGPGRSRYTCRLRRREYPYDYLYANYQQLVPLRERERQRLFRIGDRVKPVGSTYPLLTVTGFRGGGTGMVRTRRFNLGTLRDYHYTELELV